MGLGVAVWEVLSDGWSQGVCRELTKNMINPVQSCAAGVELRPSTCFPIISLLLALHQTFLVVSQGTAQRLIGGKQDVNFGPLGVTLQSASDQHYQQRMLTEHRAAYGAAATTATCQRGRRSRGRAAVELLKGRWHTAQLTSSNELRWTPLAPPTCSNSNDSSYTEQVPLIH